MAVREGRWDCTFCGTAGILGRHTTCTGCGHSRPEGTKFYLPEEQAQVVDQKLLQIAQTGADWICQYCASSNRAGQTSCQHCSAPREVDTPRQAVITYEIGQIPDQGDNATPVSQAASGKAHRGRQGKNKARWPVFVLRGLLVVGAVVLMLCGLLAYVSFKTYEVELTATGVRWERAIPIEAYRTVQEADWSVPEGGRTLATEQRIHHYEQVVDHYETKTREVCEEVRTGTETYTCGSRDLGNGFFEDKKCSRPVYKTRCHDETYQDPVYRDEPIYQTWYTYEVEKWVHDRTETASGNNQEVYWPQYTLAENERVGERTESYVVYFVDQEGQTYNESFEYNEWLKYQAEGKYVAYVDFFGEVTSIEAGG